MNLDDRPVLIDFSQGTTRDNPYAKSYLERDIKNVCLFFRKQGLVPDEKAILQSIIKESSVSSKKEKFK